MPTNFEGTLSLEITDSSGKDCVLHGKSGVYAELRCGGTYTLRAVFTPGLQWEGSASSHIQHIQIAGGVEALQVPFELRLELDFLPDVGPLERSAAIARQSDDSVTFELAIPQNVDKGSPSSETSSPEVALFVYQGSLFCAVATLPVQWESWT